VPCKFHERSSRKERTLSCTLVERSKETKCRLLEVVRGQARRGPWWRKTLRKTANLTRPGPALVRAETLSRSSLSESRTAEGRNLDMLSLSQGSTFAIQPKGQAQTWIYKFM
jgi:hypothetical protein